MLPPTPIFYFDYVDPLSYLLDGELTLVLGEQGAPGVTRTPAEVCPPPGPLLDIDGPWWGVRWAEARAVAADLGRALVEPRILPWTRKAHELVLHAHGLGMGPQAHAAVFEAIFGRGEDIGRVDVLVELARRLGLDPQEAKAVLDVDRYGDQMAALATRAADEGVEEIPTLVRGTQTLQGFHNRDALRTFLLR